MQLHVHGHIEGCHQEHGDCRRQEYFQQCEAAPHHVPPLLLPLPDLLLPLLPDLVEPEDEPPMLELEPPVLLAEEELPEAALLEFDEPADPELVEVPELLGLLVLAVIAAS